MRNMDTYSSKNDGCINEKRYSLSKAANSYSDQNNGYFPNYDREYSNLYTKEQKKEPFVDDQPIPMININAYNTLDNLQKKVSRVNDAPYGLDDKIFNASSLGLTNSDDEALDDYLNALAKNYDDIDRRIRNAERFVNQMDDTISSNGTLKKEYANLHNKSNRDENNVKYVTELRVNIVDSLKNHTASNFEERYVDRDISSVSSGPSKRLAKYSQSPLLKKRSSIPITSYTSVRNNTRRLRNRNFNLNSENEYQNRRNQCSDIEQEIVPPPKIFSSDDKIVKVLYHDMEVQTDDISKYVYGVHAKPLLENREVQTVSVDHVLRTTVDIGIGTDDQIPNDISKTIPIKLKSTHKNETSDSSFLSKSDIGNQALKSISNSIEDSDHIFKSTSNHRKKSKSPNPGSKERINKSFSINLNEPPVNTKRISDTRSKDSVKWKEELTKKTNTSDKHKFNSDCPQKNRSILRSEYPQEGFDYKDCSKNASQEIQRLLENLGTHLKASVSFREANRKEVKQTHFNEPDITSFWDNPLHTKDMINSKKSPSTAVKSNSAKNLKKPTNIINSELQAICRTIENKIKKEKNSKNIQQSSESENDFNERLHNNSGTMRSESMDARVNIRNSISNQNYGLIKKSTSNLNLSGDVKSSCNYKISKTFDLNPYDDIIKSHLSPIDRRLKSVASKNNCTILVEGPINAYDTTISQPFRNKVMYRCTVAGVCKDNLDKCINYLKETFPNTFLKTNTRPG